MNNGTSFLSACLAFFGKRTESLAEFRDEFKALTPADKQEIYDGLRAVGVECNPPTAPTTATA